MMIESLQDEVPTETGRQISGQLNDIRTKSETLAARIKALGQVIEQEPYKSAMLQEKDKPFATIYLDVLLIDEYLRISIV
jgi:hypothetical protein